MKEFLHIIIFNVVIFLIVFLILKICDKKTGENSVGGLKITYALSVGISLWAGNSLMKQQIELPLTASNVLMLASMIMIPFSAIINFGYIFSVILKMIRKKK